MPGMNSGPSPASSILVAAFRSALLHQALIIALIFFFVLVDLGRHENRDRRAGARTPPGVSPARASCCGSASAPCGCSTACCRRSRRWRGACPPVLQAADAGSPCWVVDLVNWGANIWSYHPIAAAASTVWIQIGIGLWLIFAVRGWSIRLAALSSVAWGLIVWSFGEAFGAILAPGLTVLFGAPGGVLLYVVAGALLLLPQRSWERPATGRLILGGSGVFFLGMALLQAWPGRGFWQGRLDGQPGSLTAMIQSMAGTPQPHALEVIVSGFGNFTESHGFAVNLVAVLVLAAAGAAFCVSAARSDVRLARIAVIGAAVFCLADWVLVEDLGFLGGLGTDPNSMIPLILLFTAGYLGLAPQPAADTAAVAAPMSRAAATASRQRGRGLFPGGWPGRRCAFAGAPLRVIAGIAALGVIIVGAAPMAFAAVNKTADPITAEALVRDQRRARHPGPELHAHQPGRAAGVAREPARQGRAARRSSTPSAPPTARSSRPRCGWPTCCSGPGRADAELVSVVANPTYTSLAYTRAFDVQEGLNTVPNWLYLTGTVSQLATVWHYFGIEVEDLPAGAMAAHNDIAFVISAKGVLQQEISDDPGPGTDATQSSFSSMLADSVLQSIGQNQ